MNYSMNLSRTINSCNYEVHIILPIIFFHTVCSDQWIQSIEVHLIRYPIFFPNKWISQTSFYRFVFHTYKKFKLSLFLKKSLNFTDKL